MSMDRSWRPRGAAIPCAVLALGSTALCAGAVAHARAQDRAPLVQTHKGLAIAATAVARSKSVSLRDCPPGANTQRGVIRPVDDQEFVTVTIDVTVLPSFTPVQLAKPTLVDAAGKIYNTAQSFTNVAATSPYSCEFSFRVPTATAVARLMIDDVSFDLKGLVK